MGACWTSRHRIKDDPELAEHAIQLGVGEVDAREHRKVRDIVAREGGHASPV
jgi:hypothetical protein